MNCIIIEDEIPAQEIMVSYIEKVAELNLVGIFNSSLKANSILQTKTIDIIFLDINLPAISGINFLKTLKNPPLVIMTTAHTEYAVESFEYDEIIDYLVKPFNFERFLKAINKIESRQLDKLPILHYQSVNEIKKEDKYIFINVDKTLHKISLDDVKYVQSDRNYVTVVTKDLCLSFIDSLKNWNTYLNQSNFLQIHRSFIINLNFIEKLTGNVVYIEKEKLPIGTTFRNDLLKKIKPIN